MRISSTQVDTTSKELVIGLMFDVADIGDSFTVKVVQKTLVNRSGGQNSFKTVYSKQVRASSIDVMEHRILLSDLNAYTYHGHQVSMVTEVELSKSSSFFGMFGKKKQPISLGFFQAPKAQSVAQVMIDPPDDFNVFKNIKVLSDGNKLYFLFVAAIAALMIVGNTVLGWHDQNVPDSQTIFYSHYNSDGEKQQPMFGALAVDSVFIAFFGWWLLMILRKYMSFRLVKKLGRVLPRKRYSIRSLLGGKSRVDLIDCELRVVACNIEHGIYVTGSGKKRRTHAIKTPVKCVSIFRKQFSYIPKEVEIARFLEDEICFDKVYQELAPNCMTSATHGVKLHWEVQLIHPEFVDQEVVGSSDGFHFGHFVLNEQNDDQQNENVV